MVSDDLDEPLVRGQAARMGLHRETSGELLG